MGSGSSSEAKCDSINAADYATLYATEAACNKVSGCTWTDTGVGQAGYCSTKGNTKNKLKEYISVISESFIDTIIQSQYNNNLTQYVDINCTSDETGRMSSLYQNCVDNIVNNSDSDSDSTPQQIADTCNTENRDNKTEFCRAENISLISNFDDDFINNISEDTKDTIASNVNTSLTQLIEDSASSAGAATKSDVSNNITAVTDVITENYTELMDTLKSNVSLGQQVNITDADSTGQISVNQMSQVLFDALMGNSDVTDTTNTLIESVEQETLSGINTNILKIIIIVIAVILAGILIIGFTLYIIKLARK